MLYDYTFNDGKLGIFSVSMLVIIFSVTAKQRYSNGLRIFQDAEKLSAKIRRNAMTAAPSSGNKQTSEDARHWKVKYIKNVLSIASGTEGKELVAFVS